MKEYLSLLQDIYANGYDHGARTAIGRRSVAGRQIRFNVADGTLPLVTTRQLFPKSMIGETLWFIKGSMCTKELREMGVKFWNRWAVTEKDVEAFINKYIDTDHENAKAFIQAMSDEHLDSIGPIYGPNWRNAPADLSNPMNRVSDFADIPSDKLAQYRAAYVEQNTIGDHCDFDEQEFQQYAIMRYDQSIDQLNNLVLNLKRFPYSSRLVVNAWIPQFIPYEDLVPQENVLLGKGALAPCHAFIQCFVRPPVLSVDKPKLSLLMYQRSVDTPVGAPINIAQYSLLLHMLAHVTDMEPDEFIWTTGDTHYYFDQEDGIREQLSREPLTLPKVWLNPEVKDLFAFTANDIRIEGYQSHEPIDYSVQV